MTLPAKVWHQLTWFWGIGFSGIALVNAYYVDIALSTRSALFSASTLDPKVELTELDCASTAVEQLCLAAQQSEEAWVNFKLFGTMGLTFALIIITVIFISKYIKEEK
ncbi:Intracellular septation protein IspA [hydrothermal vent metagenome]|uniref:Intracellular septation protein IspA n=1 Tax=hydrothermal vent metagenome TaxID=652676 RepID=A0A1W1DP77_9ZZZZ